MANLPHIFYNVYCVNFTFGTKEFQLDNPIVHFIKMLFKTTFALVALASTALGAPKKLQARVIDGAGWSVKSFTRSMFSCTF